MDERICELARAYAREVYEEELELLRRLARIPAPSHHEERRAAFIRDWFAQHGMDASIDEAKNVLCPMGDGESGDIVVVMAHTYTVFPDT